MGVLQKRDKTQRIAMEHTRHWLTHFHEPASYNSFPANPRGGSHTIPALSGRNRRACHDLSCVKQARRKMGFLYPRRKARIASLALVFSRGDGRDDSDKEWSIG